MTHLFLSSLPPSLPPADLSCEVEQLNKKRKEQQKEMDKWKVLEERPGGREGEGRGGGGGKGELR